MDDVNSKRCTKCGEIKPLVDYSPLAKGRFGRNPSCRECARKAARAYRAKYPERYKAASARWTREHPDERRALAARWRAANPGKGLAYDARSRGAVVVEEFTLDELFDFLRGKGIDPGKCAYCNAAREEWDHIVALKLGGTHTLDNVAPACRRCNNLKSKEEHAEARRRRP